MSGPPDNVPPRISWLLAVVGVPATVYLAITQHPLQAIVLGMLCGVIYIAKDIWQKEFQNDFVQAIADCIRSVRYFPSRWWYQGYYCKRLRKVYDSVQEPSFAPSREFELSSPELEQIFIEPLVSRKLPKESRVDSDKKPIQHYFASDPKPLVILGGLGMGKSILMQHIALMLVNRKKRQEWEVSYKLPFYLSLGLSEFVDKLKENKELSLADALEVAIKMRWKQPPPEWIERRLKKEPCLILLDGLDEVADSDIRKQVVRWIQHQIDTYDKSRFVITSRPTIYRDNPLEKVSLLEMQRFNSEQIDKFIDNWYNVSTYNSISAKKLKDELHKSKYRLHHLACIPLLLRMIIIVHQYRDELPESRIQLYEGIFEVYLGERWRWREASQDNGVLSVEEKQKILQTLAYKMTEREITQIESREVESIIKSHFENMPITLEQFLQSVQDNGILVQLPKPHYKFVHRSFQEYLAATYVKDIQQPELLVKCMNFMNLKWWHETIVLYCAQADPTPIIEACLKDMSLSKDALDLALTLYFWEPEVEKNVDQQKKSKPEVREAWERLDQTMSLAMEDKDIKLQEEIAGALLRLRRKYLIPDDEAPEGEPTKDTSLITCAEYQLFLDQPENQTRQPDHWKDDHYPRGQWLKPILGVRPSDANAFCNWLSAQEDAGAWRYRLPTSEETRDIFVTREAGRGYWIRDGNEYQFVREKEGSLSSSILSQDRLYDLWARAQDDVESSLKPKERLLADCISIVRKLEDVRRFHHALIEHVTSIREHISRRESDLQAKHKDTLEHKKGLENQIDTASAKKAEFEQTLKEIKSWKTQLTKINIEKMELQESLRDVREKKEDLQRERESLAEDFINSQRRKAGNMPQEQPTSDSGIQQAKQSQELKIAKYDQIKRIIEEKEREQKDLEKDLETANSKESELIEQLHGADEKEMSAKRQREDARKQEYNLAKKLESAKDEAKNAKQQLDSFSSFANKFYKIYKVFSLFRSTDSNALSAALANTQWLNLDRILAARANEKALDNVCAIINHNIEELTNRLDLFQRESDIAFANIESDIDNALTNARKLVHQFDQITVGRYVQKLDDVLRFCCGQLATNEKRSSMKNRRSRLHIRYFAKALAEHLSYWLQKELFSSDDSFDSFSTFQSMSRFYFDIYVAFALLEERINGNLSASEGILIVREQSTQEKTTKQLSGVIGE